MIGLRQKDVAKVLNISVQAYNAKENKKTSFKDSEKIIFTNLVKEKIPSITIQEIFFN